jgi:DNA sulfur modification protein DndD
VVSVRQPEAGKTPAEAARQLSEYLNRPAWHNGETDMQVSMQFTANGQKFNLVRKAKFEGGGAPRVSADLRIDSQVVQQASIDAEIGRQLHPQISEFFLFDGELLRDSRTGATPQRGSPTDWGGATATRRCET